MQAGRYNKRIQIIDPIVISKTEMNEDVIRWDPFLAAWAEIDPIRGREYMEAKMSQADATFRIKFRNQPGKTVTAVMKVLYGSRTFEIVSPPINPRERGAEIQLMCREIDGQSGIC
jgi:SPP1 family predicted phage head-tail adaptor